MPYKDRETYLRKQREFYFRRKTRAQRVALVQPMSGVIHAADPLTPLTPRVIVQEEHAPVLAGTRDPNRGIALRFQPAAKEQFQVDDCGNAWRVVRPDES